MWSPPKGSPLNSWANNPAPCQCIRLLSQQLCWNHIILPRWLNYVRSALDTWPKLNQSHLLFRESGLGTNSFWFSLVAMLNKKHVNTTCEIPMWNCPQPFTKEISTDLYSLRCQSYRDGKDTEVRAEGNCPASSPRFQRRRLPQSQGDKSGWGQRWPKM